MSEEAKTPSPILTAETVPAYLRGCLSKLEGLDKPITDDCEITAKPILGGNVNYAFFVNVKAKDGSEQTIFVKQAPEFVAIFGPDGFPLSSDRMQREADVYEEWRTMLGPKDASKYLPTIYHFDCRNMVVIMEFLDGYELLDHVLVQNDGVNLHEAVSTGLGDFMGKTHAATHSSNNLSKERIDYLTEHFENRPMRDIQLEFVFSKCFKEATDEQRAGLNVNEAFMKEIELLKKQYDGKGDAGNLVLSHGDLHPGSVMINESGVKVIDPEFTVYGPPGLDVGSLLSGYVLAAIHQAYSNNPEAVTTICEGARAFWNAYVSALKEGGVDSSDVIRKIEIESVGFAVTEVCRTSLGFAGGRLWLQFEDVDTKAAATKAALKLVDACMIQRHEGGMDLMLQEMQAVSVSSTK
jgi:5-methylthioribose kinase